MAPRSTALAGAQLAARQLNCESVFRGVLSYGRGWNNAPAVSVKPRRSAQPGAVGKFLMRPRSVRLASRRPSPARKRGRSLAPFAAPLSARLLRYRLKSDAERVKHFEHRSEFRRRVLAPIQASARHAGFARDLRHVTGARHVLDRAQDEPAIESLERLGEIVGNHLGIIEVTGRVERLKLDHVSLLLVV